MPNGKRNADGSSESKQREEPHGKPAKRSRVSRACDQCRASRERCDGESTCQTCQSQNRACTYNAQPKKRGIQPNYIRTLELTLAWLLQSFPEIELQLVDSLPREQHRVTSLIRSKDSEASETLHLAWRNSTVCKQIDQLLSDETVDASGQLLSDQDQSDAFNTAPVALQTSSIPWPNGQNATQPSSTSVDTSAGVAQPLQLLDDQRTNSIQYELLQLPDNALLLLEHYFAFTHSWLPMTEKSSMLKLVYSYPADGLARDRLIDAQHAELWSIMALASTQLSDDTTQQSRSRQIREVAEQFIPVIDGNNSYQVAHIRAMMILALTDIYGQRMLAAWLRIGTVVSLLLLFRILEKLDVTERWCVHIHLAAFVIETAVALHLRVPAHLEISYIETIGFVDEDGLDEWATWQSPFQTTQYSNQARAPARSFSTLNELLRRSISWRKDFIPYSPGTSSANAEKTIVFELLKNGSASHSRLQPSILVSSLSKEGGKLGSARTANDSSQQISNEPSAPLDQSTMNADWAQYQTPTKNGTHELHRFMSIPNDINNLALQDEPNVTDTVNQADPSFWMTSPAASQSADLNSILGDGSMPSADIFEQFDSLLDHQDSNQQSQFYQNLGFAPDVELAEFFGSDYQPSDPILAYLNPTLYGFSQESGPADTGLG